MGLKDIVFDGAGAKFVFFRERDVYFNVSGCIRIEMRDFSVDWNWERSPLASLAEVVGTASEHVDFRFVHYERFPRHDVRVAYASPWDPTTHSVGVAKKSVGRGFDMSWGAAKRPTIPKEWLDGNTLRVKTSPGPEFHVGDLYRIQHYYYDLGGFRFCECEDVFLENLEVESCPGFAFHFNGGRRVHMLNVNIRPPSDARRVITCTADHLHVQRSRGFFKLENCEFALGGDDCANFHDSTAFVKPGNGGMSIIVRGVRREFDFSGAVGSCAVRRGDTVELRNENFSETGFVAKVVDIRPVEGEDNSAEIFFNETLPPIKGKGFVLFNRHFDTHNIILRDCFFHDNRARGVVVQCPDVSIERCRFRHHESEAMKITTGWTSKLWCEGVGVTNMVVRDCTFERTNAAGGKRQAIFIGTYMDVPSYERVNMTDVPILRDILFDNNRFVDIPALDALVGSGLNITFRRNSFYCKDLSGRPVERPERIMRMRMKTN